jgi:NDP-sugar pyrophosphorylase family protein
MKAMVLAAGLGERMRPLTEGRAKPTLPLLHRSIIAFTLDHLKRHGVSEVVINLHYQPESIRGIVGDGSRHGLKVHYSEEPVILGTAGGLKKAEPYIRDSGTFLMVNSDSISDCDLVAAIKKHRETRAIATMVLIPPRAGVDYGVVEVNDNDRITRIAGNPQGDPDPRASRYNFSGIHIIEPELFDKIPPQGKSEINRVIYPGLLTAGGAIRAFVHTGFWRELGNPALYLEGSLALLREGKDPSLAALRSSDGVYLDRVSLPRHPVIEPPVVIGRGATIGDKASFQAGVVVGKQATIGKGCSLRSTIVWDGARIGDGSSLSECIVTSGVFVPANVSLSNKIFLRAQDYHGPKDRLERLGSCWMTSL